MLRTALLVAGKDLRQRLRDRSALVIAFVAPFVLATIIGLAFGGDSAFRATYAVADAEGHVGRVVKIAVHAQHIRLSPEAVVAVELPGRHDDRPHAIVTLREQSRWLLPRQLSASFT